MDITTAILKIGIVLLVGYFGGKLAQKIKLPNVSGYLILGLFLGPSVAILLSDKFVFISKAEMKQFDFIKEIALAFIAFSIGSEFKLKNIKKNGKSIGIITFFEVFFAVVFVFLIILFLPKPRHLMPSDFSGGYGAFVFSRNNLSFTLVIGAMAATTAPAATLLVIRQYKAYGPLTRTIVPVAAIDDIFGIVAFGLMYSLAETLISVSKLGPTIPIAYQIAKPFIDVLVSTFFGLLVGVFLSSIINKMAIDKYEKQVLALLSVLIVFAAGTLITNISGNHYISLSPLLANIAAGAVVSNRVKRDHEIYDALNDFTNPFLILFFTLAGASLDLSILKSSWQIIILAIGYILCRATGKYVGAYTGAVISKKSPLVQKYLGFGLFPQGGLSLGLIVVVSQNHNPEMQAFGEIITAVMLISVMIYETLGPIFAKIAIQKAGEVNGLERYGTCETT